MSYEAQDVVKEAPAAPSSQGGSLQSEAYSLLSSRQFTSDSTANNTVNQTFGSLELFGDDGAFLNQSKPQGKPEGKSDSDKEGKTETKSFSSKEEKIDAAVIEGEDGSVTLEYANGAKTVVSKDDKVTEFDKDGKEIKDTPIAAPSQLSPEEMKKAVDDLLEFLPDFEVFEKPNVPRNDGIIRQREQLDKDLNLNKVTEYPNGVSISKSESTVKGEDGKVTHKENVVVKFPEGAQPGPDGAVLDKNGKMIYKENADGSRQIFMNDTNGKPVTVTEFPNGVRITKGEPETIEKDGKKITVDGGRVIVFPEGAAKAPDGTIVDSAGRPLMKENKDGSVTVFDKEGTYTQSADGKVTFKKKPQPVK